MLRLTLAAMTALIFVISLKITMRAQDEGESQVIEADFEAETLGRMYQYRAYLPAGYDTSEARYPVIYLLHGRGDTMSAWLNVRSALDEMIANDEIPPIIAIMPDMPSSDRGNYYVDSAYTGHLYRPEAVETAFFNDLMPHIDGSYRTLADRRSRMIGGYSMGGYGAIRYALAHPDQLMGAIILSPAVYTPLPPDDSSAREFGAFGKDSALFDADIYRRLNYPTLLEILDGSYRLNLFIAVGDDEWKHPNAEDMEHDLDFESHRFFNRVSRTPGIASEFRVYDGGHDWDVWLPGFVEGIRYLANYLDTTDHPSVGDATNPLDGWVTGSVGDDYAGGLGVDTTNGDMYQALAVTGSLGDQPHSGNQDVAIVKYGADRSMQWIRQFGTVGNDRPYGLVVTSRQEGVVVGYTQGDFDDAHPGNNSDDIFVLKLNANGDLIWRTQFGTPEADRGYAIALAPDDAIVVSGYSKGNLSTVNAGDKDIITALLNADGELIWSHQFGGEGEDKGQAVAVGPDGAIYSAGMTASVLTPDAAGGIDAFVLKLTEQGDLDNLLQFGTIEWDEATGAAVSNDGLLVVAGFTAGDLVGEVKGDKDIFMMAFDSTLRRISADQLGSNLNDKGAAVTFADNGDVILAGYSNGDIANSIGDFDVIVVRYDAAFSRQEVWQIGTPLRDATDEWAEKNLFIASYGEGVVLSGLTLGNIAFSTISGGSDAFIIFLNLNTLND